MAARVGVRRWWPPLLAGGLVAVLGLALLRPAPSAAAGAALSGQPAPEFRLASLEGPEVALSELRGRPVVLNFWASWCGPCREEAPMLGKLQTREEAREGGARVVGVLFQETNEESARRFIREFGLTYPNLRDPGLDTGIRYGVTGIPVTVFIDAQGTVQHTERGGLSRDTLNAGLARVGVPALP